VTVNYRLVVFGFPSGIEGIDLNVGLHDQRLATEWVKDNIESFGGMSSTQSCKQYIKSDQVTQIASYCLDKALEATV
jgi:carboxylesterase type B